MTIEAHRTLKSYCIGEQCKQFFASFYLVGNSCSLQHLFDTTFSLFALLFFLLISPIFNFYYLLMNALINFCERMVPPQQEWPTAGEPVTIHGSSEVCSPLRTPDETEKVEST